MEQSKIFADINRVIFEKEHVDLQHIYIDGSKFEANANKYSWVWKRSRSAGRIGTVIPKRITMRHL